MVDAVLEHDGFVLTVVVFNKLLKSRRIDDIKLLIIARI